MSVQEIEAAITRLSKPELSQLASWFAEYQANLWDAQIEQDALAGRFDAFAEEANREFAAGRCRLL